MQVHHDTYCSASGFPARMQAEYLQMPASAKHMLLHYLKIGRFDDHLYGGITEHDETGFVIMRDFED